jgi:hypothetical protein
MTNDAQSSPQSDFGPDDDAPGAQHNPALLADVTRALLPFMGPYSITTVKRASRSTVGAKELVKLIATQIDDLPKREQFLRAGKRIVRQHDAATNDGLTTVSNVSGNKKTTPENIESGARAPAAVTPELLQRAEAALAPIIGPLAGVLVARYGTSANSREFFDRLATHLRSKEERNSFFDAVRAGLPEKNHEK